MAKGLKESKVAMFDINYEPWYASGTVYLPDDAPTEYIIGVTEELPKPEHANVFVDVCEDSVPVYLEANDTKYENTWNKTYKDKSFSDKITNTENETEDLNLYAKWYQEIYSNIKGYYGSQASGKTPYDWQQWGQGPYDISDWTTIFSWT